MCCNTHTVRLCSRVTLLITITLAKKGREICYSYILHLWALRVRESGLNSVMTLNDKICKGKLEYLIAFSLSFLFLSAGGMKIISRLVQIHNMDKRSKLEEERGRERQVPSSPTIEPASPLLNTMEKATCAQFGEGEEVCTDGGEGGVPIQRRRSSSNRLRRQENSVREGTIVFVICS